MITHICWLSSTATELNYLFSDSQNGNISTVGRLFCGSFDNVLFPFLVQASGRMARFSFLSVEDLMTVAKVCVQKKKNGENEDWGLMEEEKAHTAPGSFEFLLDNHFTTP